MSDPREFYEIKANDGIIVNKRLGNRAFVFGLQPWTLLVQRLHSMFGTAAETILFEIGKSYGLSCAQEEKRADILRDISVNYLARQAALGGWGKIVVNRVSPNEFKITVQGCVFCAGMGDSRERNVACFFLRGIISGFAEALYGSAKKTNEIHCGEDYCEFVVEVG